MNQQNNILINQIFVQVVLGLCILCVSIISELLMINILPVGCLISLFFLGNGFRLYKIWEKGDFIQLTGTCVEVDFNKITKRANVAFRFENGFFLRLSLKGTQSLPIESEQYVFLVKKKEKLESISHSDILAWSIYQPIQN